jgi:hypothetical protein
VPCAYILTDDITKGTPLSDGSCCFELTLSIFYMLGALSPDGVCIPSARAASPPPSKSLKPKSHLDPPIALRIRTDHSGRAAEPIIYASYTSTSVAGSPEPA